MSLEWVRDDAGVGGYEPRAGGSGAFLSAVVTLTPDQVLPLNSNPPELIAAPGAGKVIMPVFANVLLLFATTPYVAPGGLDQFSVTWDSVDNGPYGTVPVKVTNTIQNSSNQLGWGANDNRNDDGLALFDNAPIIAWHPFGDYTDGDSPVRVTVGYMLLDVAP